MFEQCAQAVAVGAHQNGASGDEIRHNRVVPVREHTIDHDRKALTCRQNLCGKLFVTCVVSWVALVIEVQCRRWYVEGSAPLQDGFVTVFIDGFFFVEALERTVVAFVQTPRAAYWNPVAIDAIEDRVGGMDGAFEQRG